MEIFLPNGNEISVIYWCTFDICDFAGARLSGVTIAEHLTEGKYSPEEKEQRRRY